MGLSTLQSIKLRSTNPDMTLEAIGNIVGVTKERVRQILKKAGMETRSTKEIYERRSPHLKFGNPCPTCNKPAPYKQKKYGLYTYGYYLKYHVECRPSKVKIDLICPYCDKSFQIDKTRYFLRIKRINVGGQKAIYCSHQCVSNAYWDSVHQGQQAKRHTSSWTSFICGTCNTEKFIRKQEYFHRITNSQTGILFCDHICLGHWIRQMHKKGNK